MYKKNENRALREGNEMITGNYKEMK